MAGNASLKSVLLILSKINAVRMNPSRNPNEIVKSSPRQYDKLSHL